MGVRKGCSSKHKPPDTPLSEVAQLPQTPFRGHSKPHNAQLVILTGAYFGGRVYTTSILKIILGLIFCLGLIFREIWFKKNDWIELGM